MQRGLPGIFEKTIFGGRPTIGQRRVLMSSSFVRPMHPKKEIRPDAGAIQRVLDAGWVGQMKVHGHRAQIHISADPRQEILAYNRQGRLHTKGLSPGIEEALRAFYTPAEDWTILDAEWLKGDDKLFVFDLIKDSGEILTHLTFPERFERIKKDFISPYISVLPLLKTMNRCMAVLEQKDDYVEGLVFKSTTRAGFEDTSIVRCRRPGTQHSNR